MRAALLALTFALVPMPAAAQVAPPDGLYEDFSSLTMSPVGPLTASPSHLARWVEVRTTGGVTEVTFLPDRRIVWRITWGASGPTRKTTEVDGVVMFRSRFEHDASGHLTRKVVEGPRGTPTLSYDYVTDTSGHVVSRTASLPPVVPGGPSVREELLVSTTASGTELRTTLDGRLRREDHLDAAGRLVSTTIHGARGDRATLDYVRDATGALLSVRRTLPGGRVGPATPAAPDPSVTSADVELVVGEHVAGAAIERHEALLFLGAPITSTDAGRGTAREIRDDWAAGCWMNATSGITFDAAGRSMSGTTGCICGFCVAATLEVEADGAVLAVDLHFTEGPWIRLDGAVDVTADHEVMTPSGPRSAGSLAAGDVVLASDGAPHVLVSVESLPPDGLRLGRNVRTSDGTFAAGGFLFASERPRACE